MGELKNRAGFWREYRLVGILSQLHGARFWKNWHDRGCLTLRSLLVEF
jgi:hypothetical protein